MKEEKKDKNLKHTFLFFLTFLKKLFKYLLSFRISEKQ